MSLLPRTRWVWAFAFAGALAASATAQSNTFRPIDFPADWVQVTLRSLDSRGEVLLGTARPEEEFFNRYWVLEQPTGFRFLDPLPQGAYGALTLSGNGEWILGNLSIGFLERLFRLNRRTQQFDWLSDAADAWAIGGANFSGNLLVGAGPVDLFVTHGFAARPGASVEFTSLALDSTSLLAAISADGDLAVGTRVQNGASEAIRWLNGAGGFFSFVPLRAGEMTDATAISADGRHVFGRSVAGFLSQPVRWVDGNPEPLVPRTNFTFAPLLTFPNEDGSLVVAGSFGNWSVIRRGSAPLEVPLVDYLSDELGLAAQVQGWQLDQVLFFSQDGSTLVGSGRDPDGVFRFWTVRIQGRVITNLTPADTALVGGQSTTATVRLSAPAGFFGERIHLASDTPAVQVPATVTVPRGATEASFNISTSAVAGAVGATITATLRNDVEVVNVQVDPILPTSLAFDPNSVRAGSSSTGTVTLNAPAPSPVTVALSSSNAAVAVPATVTVPTNASSATFTATTTTVASATVAIVTAATPTGLVSATLTVQPSASLVVQIAPASVVGTQQSTGTVVLPSAAPAGGRVVTLSSNSSAATVPASVTVAAGATSANFTINTRAVASDTVVQITAVASGASGSSSLIVRSPIVAGLTLSPGTLGAGELARGTVRLNGPAPTGGASVALSASVAGALTLPTTVTVPANARSVEFNVRANSLTSEAITTVTARRGSGQASATLRVRPVAFVLFEANERRVEPGDTVRFTVGLDAPAPAGGLVFTLTSSRQDLLPVRATVTIAAGQRTATFTSRAGRTPRNEQVRVTASSAVGTRTERVTVERD